MSARRAALATLDATLGRKATLDRAFDRAARTERLEGPDRAFARALASTTLRRLGQLDAAIAPLLKRPLPNKALTAKNILRLGAAQILFLKTPAHAAVGETTGLATGRASAYRGLVNAVLRRLTESGDAALDGQDAARLNTPGWLWESWREAYGAAGARAIAEAHMHEAPLDLTVFNGDAASWGERLSAALLPTGSLRRAAGGRPTDLPGFDEGAWTPQDAAAALPARMLGDVEGQHVVDLCAAPGGKTAQLASAGARVTAVDLSRDRLDRLEANLARLGLTAEIVAADAVEWRPPAPVDAILLDAPCASTGTIRRRPDVAWTKSSRQVKALTQIQSDLLYAAADMLKPGGRLAYACCSLQPAEGPDLIARFLGKRADFDRAPIDLAGLPDGAVTADGDLRTLPSMWPDLGGMDGFYAAALVKRPQ